MSDAPGARRGSHAGPALRRRTTSPSGPRTAESGSSTSCARTAAASLLLARTEGNGLRCIYHGWKMDVSGCVVDCPNQAVRAEQFAASVPVVHFPVHECGWPRLGVARRRRGAAVPRAARSATRTCTATGACRGPCNWLQGIEGTIDSAHVGLLHQTWIAEAAKMAEHSNLTMALDQPPKYETQSTPTACGRPRCARLPTARPTSGSPST